MGLHATAATMRRRIRRTLQIEDAAAQTKAVEALQELAANQNPTLSHCWERAVGGLEQEERRALQTLLENSSNEDTSDAQAA